MRKVLFSIVILLIVVSCGKYETAPPEVIILSPLAEDSFYVADSVNVHFTIADKNLIAYKIIISNFLTNKILFREDVSVTSDNVMIDKKIFIDVTSDTTAYINVLGIDKNGNTGGAGAKFKLKK